MVMAAKMPHSKGVKHVVANLDMTTPEKTIKSSILNTMSPLRRSGLKEPTNFTPQRKHNYSSNGIEELKPRYQAIPPCVKLNLENLGSPLHSLRKVPNFSRAAMN